MDDLRRAFDPEVFRSTGHVFVDQLADYLAAALRGTTPVLPAISPGEIVRVWGSEFPEQATGGLQSLLQRVIESSNHLHHPRYIGHQVTAPLPMAALCDLAAALLNNGMAVFDMGPAATAMERSVVGWMARQLGFGPAADGVLTSGGSVGNLTALLAARQAKAGFDVWSEGAHAGPPLAVLASDQTHYCVQRAVQIMGWGAGGVVVVPSDAGYRMRTNALGDAFRRAQHAGRSVIGVVASAGSTATGAFDPLESIADFCRDNDLWLHVDGAHGASLVLSERHRGLLRGIERADSVVWDAHKMLLMPALVTGVLFRDGARSYQAFAQEATYLFAGEEPQERWFDIGARTLECTKKMLSFKIYAALQVYGTRLFGDYLARTIDLAQRFAARLREAPDFEIAVEPQCNILCFRHVPPGVADLDALQLQVRQRLLETEGFYLVQTRLRGKQFLRTTLINPFTSDADLEALMHEIRRLAASA
ncbi:MAG: pyridoxal-dependent decarboxylase [Deltaproteobacteria bacterium]|nr:pyridoxal-dependent decarboxylase [Deltaproteobacteria bacterium]